jgi:hypothetical protein
MGLLCRRDAFQSRLAISAQEVKTRGEIASADFIKMKAGIALLAAPLVASLRSGDAALIKRGAFHGPMVDRKDSTLIRSGRS